jgi:hypothetical protein
MRLAVLLSVFMVFGYCWGEGTRQCADAPVGHYSFNSDWYYADFQIPEYAQVVSLYGGFDRPGYIPAHYDYIAQYFLPGQTITSLDDFQLFNYDQIDVPLYYREYDVRNLWLFGMGTVRLSVPITHGVVWNEACVTYEEKSDPSAVPEPGTLALFAVGIPLAVFATRRIKAQANG